MIPHYVYFSCVLRLLLAVTFSQTLFLMTWQFWGILIRHFVECSSTEMCLMVFALWWDESLEGRLQRSSFLFITSYQGCLLSTVEVDLGHWAQGVFVRLLHCSYSSVLYTLWNEITICRIHLRSGYPQFFKHKENVKQLLKSWCEWCCCWIMRSGKKTQKNQKPKQTNKQKPCFFWFVLYSEKNNL